MFYKLIDECTIEEAPTPLKINGNHIFTNDETVFNQNGFYKLVTAEYPQEDKCYKCKYILQDNKIMQVWTEKEFDIKYIEDM